MLGPYAAQHSLSAHILRDTNCTRGKDFAYIYPRSIPTRHALPPNVRAEVTGAVEKDLAHEVLYNGACNVRWYLRGGQFTYSGAGTRWENDSGHAYVRKGSGAERIAAAR